MNAEKEAIRVMVCNTLITSSNLVVASLMRASESFIYKDSGVFSLWFWCLRVFAVWKQCIVWRFTYLYSYNKLSRRLPSLFAGIGVELTWKILFTENIVIIRAVTGICYRIFGVESINIMELIHEGDEKVHIWTVLVHINNRYYSSATPTWTLYAGSSWSFPI